MSDQPIPRLVLVDGDPVLSMDAIIKMKNKWIKESDNNLLWNEVTPPTTKKSLSEFLNFLDGEVSMADFGGERKVIFLRGVVDSRVFCEALLKITSSVSPSNTLLVFDEEGVIRSEIKSEGKESIWGELREKFTKHGTILALPLPFKELDTPFWGQKVGNKHIKAVMDELEKKGKKMSYNTTRDVFLERVCLDWSFILGELDKLAELVPSESVSAKDVMEIVFPSAPNHAIYEFAMVFNDWNYEKVMSKYDELIASKVSHEQIFSFCMKLIRWQMIASHLISYGQLLPDSLVSFSSSLSPEKSAARTSKLKKMKPHLFKRPKVNKDGAENKEEPKDETLSNFVAKGVSSFVKDKFTKKVAIKSGQLGTLPFMKVAMSRYMAMLSCIENVRMRGSDTAREEFRRAMLKVCSAGE
jgi:hypothetical protein